MRRKLFLLGLCFAFGTAAAIGVPAAGIRLLVLLVPAGTGALLLFGSEAMSESGGFRLSLRFRLAILLVTMVGFGAYSLQTVLFSMDAQKNGKQAMYTGQVLSVQRKTKVTELEVLLSGNTMHIRRIYPEKVLLSVNNPEMDLYALAGCYVSFSAVLEAPEPKRNPGGFDDVQYLRSRGISHRARVSGVTRLSKNPGIYGRVLHRSILLREQFLSRVTNEEDVRGFLRGVLFGDSTGLSEEDRELFRNNGTAHILAVSGLHIGVLFSLYRRIRKRLARRSVTVVFLGLLLFYGMMTGWSVSVLRAVLLILVLLFGEFLDRRYDLLTALAFAGMVLLLQNPGRILGASFQLSFLAVLTMAFVTPMLKRKLPEEVSAAIAVQFGMLPYMAYSFRRIPLLGWACNVPTLFLSSLLLPVGILCFAILSVPGMPEGLIILPNRCLIGLSRMTIWVNRMLSGDGRFARAMVPPGAWMVLLFYLVVFFLCSEFFRVYWKRREHRLVLGFGILMITISLAAAVLGNDPVVRSDVWMVDVGQGDAMVFRGEGGRSILIDGGGNRDRNVGKTVLQPFLLECGIRNPDVAFVTHLHTDHYKGVQELEELGMVRTVEWTGTQGMEMTVAEDLQVKVLWPLEESEAEEVGAEEAGGAGRALSGEEGSESSEEENRNSRVYMVTIKGVRVLVTGDLTAEGEQMLLDLYEGTGELSCDILKVGHHGSKSSTSEEFLDATNPQLAWIGVGKRNLYGHPSKEVLTRLEKHGIIVFRTDQNGAIGARIGKNGRIRICTEIAKEKP